MAKISLESIAFLSTKDRAIASLDLSSSRKRSLNLEHELPIPAEGYNNPIRAFRRLGRIARTQSTYRLEAFLIKEDDTTIGMATAQAYQPYPVEIGEGAVELSYWHDNKEPLRDRRINVRLGKEVVSNLMVIDWSNPYNYPTEPRFWMVTMPMDAIKSEVCRSTGMEPLGKPQTYLLEDENDAARQLWVASA